MPKIRPCLLLDTDMIRDFVGRISVAFPTLRESKHRLNVAVLIENDRIDLQF